MPMTKEGKKVMKSMMKEYKDPKKAKQVFYASINKGKAGSSKWHKTSKASYSSGAIKHAMSKNT